MALKVNYAIGALTNARNKANADLYLKWLATPGAKAAYAKHEFVPATDDELRPKPLR